MEPDIIMSEGAPSERLGTDLVQWEALTTLWESQSREATHAPGSSRNRSFQGGPLAKNAAGQDAEGQVTEPPPPGCISETALGGIRISGPL